MAAQKRAAIVVYRQQLWLWLLQLEFWLLGGKNSPTGNWTFRNISQGSSWQGSSHPPVQLQSLVGMQ